jgi:propanol-preferring alcohol dehydrogenase
VIPQTQEAAVGHAARSPLQFVPDHRVCQPAPLNPGECLVKMTHTGVCHTDLHAKMGDFPVAATYPLIGGHEGVGVIVAIGAHSDKSPVTVGERVGIKWLAYSCLNCEFCRTGYAMSQSVNKLLAYYLDCINGKLSGYTVNGTFSEYVVSFVSHVTPIPKGLDSAEAASILRAGVTTYKALRNET